MPVARPPDAGNPLARFATLWRAQEERSARRALWAFAVTAALASAHLARLGTPLARGLTAGLLLGVLLFAAFVSIRARRAYRSQRGIIEKVLVATDPEIGQRARRALGLIERADRAPAESSPELARLHFERTIARLTPDRIEARAALSARRWRYLGFAAGVAALASVLPGPFRVVEGLDVLLSRKGEAPLAFDWLDDLLVVAHPPPYLHESDRIRTGFGRMTLPRGTTLTVRGTPVHQGRKLVLHDGQQEVPFVDDAAKGMVARFTLGESTELRIASRFGDVRIPQRGSLELKSIPDLAPEVDLEGAPRTVRLLEEPEITLSYEARDDHGLREVHLVLRAGTREDRRVLAQLDGEPRLHRGAIRLRASDPFIKRMHLPVEVSVEARDNDPITGPQWGRSAALMLIPPAIGEPEAMRYAALARARDALVDLTAFRIGAEVGKGRAAIRDHAAEEAEQTARALAVFDEAVESIHGGLKLPRRTAVLARAQARKLRDALAAEIRKTTQANHDKHRTVTEDVTLAFDVALRVLGARDSASVSRRLADVADDCSAGAEQARSPTDRERGVARLEAAAEVLRSGGEQLLRLGALGEDLGHIVESGLARILRARGEDDFFHAELAARDLAARLRNPVPSFSGGGGGGGGGVESGGGSSEAEPGDGSDAEGEIARQQQELEELTRDHAAELAEVEQALREGTDPRELERLSDEARKRAEEVRDAARGLRSMSGEPGTAEASAATGREHAEAMAGALDRGSLADAVESGRHARRALEEAERKPSSFSPFDDARVHEQAGRARERIAEQLAWAEQALEQLRKSASMGAKERLQESARREGKLADRARDVSELGKDGMTELPEETQELLREAESSMREAQRALAAAKGEQALEKQRNAQRLLERAREDANDGGGEGDEPSSADMRRADRGGSRESNEPNLATKLPIPAADAHKGPEAFRRRVLEGLGGSQDPRLREAVKRYAEGLLK